MPARKQRRTRRPAAAVAAAVSDHAGAGRAAAVIFLGLLAIYCSNLRVLATGDNLPTRVLPFSILREGNLDLNEFTWERTRNGRLPYYLHRAGWYVYSVSTIATPLVITPLYVVPAWMLAHYGIG